jgi:hypothetical protein
MKIRYIHRLFMYSLCLALLVGYFVSKDANLWSAFTHLLTTFGGLEIGNGIAAANNVGTVK